MCMCVEYIEVSHSIPHAALTKWVIFDLSLVEMETNQADELKSRRNRSQTVHETQ